MNNMYLKLSTTNMKNNRQFYLPYLLMGIITVTMNYTMVALNNNKGLEKIPGVMDLRMILVLGTYVIGICSVIFLFYTNSFIMKRRKKELGVYNILGMEKKHIARLLLAETLIQALVSIVLGLIVGIAFNKLMMMLLYKLTGFENSVEFEISSIGIRGTVILFAIIYLVIYIYDLMQVQLSKPIELLHGGNVGEREPKTKLLLAIIGIGCIAAGYYIATTTKNPMSALVLFFVAVILVIAGTYALFTAGSIVLLKMLRKNKAYYYQSAHFTSVSGMMYRMKQNAVGLANICILSTMVLVMVSTTVSMFIGVEDELDSRYAAEIAVTGYYDTSISEAKQDKQVLVDKLEETIQSSGRSITDASYYYSLTMVGLLNQGDFVVDDSLGGTYAIDNAAMITCMTWDDYQLMNPENGKKLSKPQDGQAIIVGSRDYNQSTFTLDDLTIPVEHAYQFDDIDTDEITYLDSMSGIYYLILPQDAMLDTIYQKQRTISPERSQTYHLNMNVNIDGTGEEKLLCDQQVTDMINSISAPGASIGHYSYAYVECRQLNQADFYTIYGGLFFIGLFLGSMFLLVTVLIIFYKQISEGYEDKERFAIMEKVGMSNQEVKATISSQIRIVFFLPLITACIHVFAAFPMIRRILALLNLTNSQLFFYCMLATIGVFTIIYFIVFKMTSKNYYNIVGEQV